MKRLPNLVLPVAFACIASTPSLAETVGTGKPESQQTTSSQNLQVADGASSWFETLVEWFEGDDSDE